ncbi:hypothetical protein OS493_025503, partial [Desmophyllum pertusum]
SQKEARANEELNSSGSWDKEDKKEQEHGPEQFRDEPNQNTLQGSKQGESKQKSIKAPKREDVSAVRDVSASKRAGPFAAVLANPKVQEAVVEKGIEVAGKLVDKQLKIIDDAQQKAADFLKKEVREEEL